MTPATSAPATNEKPNNGGFLRFGDYMAVARAAAAQSSPDVVTPVTLRSLKPQLDALVAEAKAHHQTASKRFCANEVWFGYPGTPYANNGLQRRLHSLADWGGKVNPTTRECSIAGLDIYDALPGCRGCGCPE